MSIYLNYDINLFGCEYKEEYERFAKVRWKKLYKNHAIRWMRVGKSTFINNIDSDGRWLLIPCLSTIPRGTHCKIIIVCKSKYAKNDVPLYLLGDANKIQRVMKLVMKEGIYERYEGEFEVKIQNAKFLFISTSDFPMSGEFFEIEKIVIEDYQKEGENYL